MSPPAPGTLGGGSLELVEENFGSNEPTRIPLAATRAALNRRRASFDYPEGDSQLVHDTDRDTPASQRPPALPGAAGKYDTDL